MALFAGQVQTTPYQAPDYAGSVAAVKSLAMTRAQGIAEPFRQIADYTKQQKDLAQKDKEMAAKIKGTISLLDNAKALYPDFAERIDATKLQLSDPSLSTLDRSAIASSVADSLNMMTTQGSEAVKKRLAEAQIANYERDAEVGGATLTEQIVTNPATGEQELVSGYARPDGTFAPLTAVAPAAQPQQGTPQAGLGAPPMDIPTVNGPPIPANEGQLINGGRQVIYKQGIYDVDTGVLPPKDQAGAAISAAQNINVPSAVGAPNAGAIAQTSQMFGPASSRISGDFLAQAGYPSGGEPQAMAQPVQAAPAPIAQPQAAPAQIQAAPSRMVMPAPKKYAPESPAAQASRKLRDDLTTAEIAIAKNKLAEAQGTQEQKEKTAAEARMANDRAKREALTIVKSATSLTNEILKNIPEDNAASTLWRSLAPEAIAREQKKLSNALKPIEAQVMLRTLNSLREASTTGGSGLGPLSDREGQLLMSSIASLDPLADPTDIRRSLKAINDHFINAEFGDREERIQLVKENKMTVPKFNEIEAKYSSSKPLKLPDIPLTNRTPAQEEALNKHLQSR